MALSRSRQTLLIVLLAVTLLSWAARTLQHQRVQLPGHESWVTTDADTLYHLRRVHRLMADGFPVAESDPYLNHPHGSAIPWPPYYTLVSWALTAPFAPDEDAERRGWVERRVASLPLLFGVLTSLAAALAARALAGNVAALLAGGYHALCMASIAYSKSGNGDHHAWITWLVGILLWMLSSALARDSLSPREGALRGAALGAVAGVALGSWVASLLYVVPVQLSLGWWVIVHSRRPNPGLPALGFAFHAAALLVLLPAVLSSPWTNSNPWMVVNLTGFHAAWLGLGAAVFAPLLFVRGGRGLRAYPVIATGALALLAAFLLTSGSPPAVGVREGFAWMSREEDFMASVWESRGLLGGEAAFDPFAVLGWGAIILPLAWAAAAWRTFRDGRLALLPWAVTVPLLALQAARQVRFADALALPMAVVVAWGCVEAVRAARRRRRGKKRKRMPAWVPWAAAVAGLAVTQSGAIGVTTRLARAKTGSPEHPSAPAMREMCDWLRANTDAGDWSVMARWNWGHVIEWAADRPSVATNFGTYVGEDSFRDPSRFFLAEDAGRAAEVLEGRRARFVALTSWLPGTARQMIRDVDPRLEARYLEPTPTEEARLRFDWFRTMGARLMYDGATLTPQGPVGTIDFLRLVFVSPRRDPRPNPRGEPSPAGWLWEWVPGAILEAGGNPGEELRVDLEVRYLTGRYQANWTYVAACGADGIARLRFPYATDAPNGDGVVARAVWSVGQSTGALTVPEAAVLRGTTIPLITP